MIYKLTGVVEALQDEIMTQNSQIQELIEENAKLRSLAQIP